MQRLVLKFIIFLCVSLLLVSVAYSQQKGQYVPGQAGLNAGILPDPGFTYVNMTLDFSSSTFKNGSGTTTPLLGSYDVWAIENFFFYVPKFRFLGGKLAFMIIAPTPANGSLTLGAIEFPNRALNAGGFGIGDIWAQPVTLGWSLKRVDTYAGYGFVAPTGRYTPGASNNIGSGYWGNDILTGTTVYLTKNKGTTFNLFTDWEIHGSKQTGQGTRLTPGQTFNMEWGLGQALPLKEDMSVLLQLGVIGYDVWQVSNNGGLIAPLIPARLVPYYSGQAIGVQSNLILPTKSLNFFFKYEDEYNALASPKGRTFVFGGSYTFRIPKPARPANP